MCPFSHVHSQEYQQTHTDTDTHIQPNTFIETSRQVHTHIHTNSIHTNINQRHPQRWTHTTNTDTGKHRWALLEKDTFSDEQKQGHTLRHILIFYKKPCNV